MTELTVHLRVNDAATGQPTPVRLRISGPDGQTFAPLGRLTRFPVGSGEAVGLNVLLGNEPFALIDGTCEVRLPTEVPLRLQVDKGPCYAPLDQTVTLGPGQMALRLRIERCLVPPGASLDLRCHALTPHAAALEGAAGGLDVVQLLVRETTFSSLHSGEAFVTLPNLEAFSGQQPALVQHGCSVVVNTLNTHPVLGSLALLQAHRVIYPLAFGGPDATDDWSLGDWADQCHRKGGLVVWVDAPGTAHGGEALAALILGRVDALELAPERGTITGLREAYRLWSAGLRVPIVGASGKQSNREALGSLRTLTLDGPDWLAAVKAGRTAVSNGPVVRLLVNDQPPGARLTLPPGETLRVVAWAESVQPFERLEVVADGKVIGTASPSLATASSASTALAESTAVAGAAVYTAKLELTHALESNGWLAARVVAGARSWADRLTPLFAHTSCVMVEVGVPGASQVQLRAQLSEALARVGEWAESVGRYALPQRRQALLETLTAARARLEAGGC